MGRTAAALALLAAVLAPSADAQAPAPAQLRAVVATAREGDTLPDLARANGLGYVELVAANPGVDPWRPRPGHPVVLPVAHLAPELPAPLVVNLGDMRLYHRRHGGSIASFPIGIGRDGWELAAGMSTTVVRKRERPTWVPPASIRAEKPWLPASVPPGPDNPLGEYSLDLGLGLIRIHGTNRPDGVGRRVSHGCIRLYPEDIARLFPDIAVGTAVAVVDQPAKLAWLDDGELWLEIHPSQDQADAVEYRRPLPRHEVARLEERVLAAAGAEAARIDWGLVAWAEETRLGVPVRVTRPAAGPPTALLAEKERPGGHASGP
ncbi:MAG: L,D-transpeptidase family protein [Pseudomonadota bacterium]